MAANNENPIHPMDNMSFIDEEGVVCVPVGGIFPVGGLCSQTRSQEVENSMRDEGVAASDDEVVHSQLH
jgi:hypothetical protein